MALTGRPLVRVALLLVTLVLGPGAARADELDAQDVNLVLRLDQRRLYVVPSEHDDDTRRPIASFRVAIGRDEWPTPVGRFTVREKLVEPDFVRFDWDDPGRELDRLQPGHPDNPLGERWIGFATSAHGWQIGFHGTPRPELLGKAVSHGCVRMRNADVIDLFGRVAIGTPVIVRP